MVQIVKRKKKGRPSKADLAKRAAEEAATALQSQATESDTRRSLRRRNVKYNFDYDDYLEEEEDEDKEFDDDEDDEDDRHRKEKKLKVVLKLPTVDRSRTCARDVDAHEAGDDFDDREQSRRKRNQIDDDGEEDDKDNDNDENDSDGDEDEDNEIRGNEEKGRPGNSKGGHHSVPDIPSETPSMLPLPSDRKTLEIILDKLQKKDIYGVYAEPVDPEELPDYHEIIENPMDFGTVRKKLATGSYSTLKQIESDVYLICANAMQYNAPDTVYYKQARTIQELAKRKFLKVRINVEKELKSELKTLPNSTPKKQISTLVSLTSQEPVGSDFSAGPTLPSLVNPRSSPNVKLPGCSEKPSNGGGSMEGNYSLFDNNLEKTHDLSSGKGHMYKFGKKPNALDGDRRATYNTTNHSITKSESVYTIFEGEHKHLVAVGLHTDHSYARSMARFAAALGPFGWNIASKKIEQALPTDVKYGRGWVGEYEPLPTPVVLIENHTQKATAFFKKRHSTAGFRTNDRIFNTSIPAKESFVSGSVLEGKLFGSPASSGTEPFTPINNVGQQQNPFSKNNFVSANKAVKQVDVNFSFTTNQNKANIVGQKFTESPRHAASRALENVPDKKQTVNGTVSVELPNGKVINSTIDSKRLVSSSADSVPNQMVRPETFPPRGSVPNQMVRPKTFSPRGSIPNQMARSETFSPCGQMQNLNNPALSMRSVHEMAQRAQISSNNQLMDSNNAATTAARAWMSIGAGGFKPTTESSNQHQLKSQISADSLYNPARNNLNPQMLQFRGQFPPAQNNSIVSQQQPIRAESQFQNTPTVYPHLGATDLSKFQMQSTNWRGLSPHVQQRKKQDTFPPDLNISFQSSAASPVRQSTGVLVDSQQPDLALQL